MEFKKISLDMKNEYNNFADEWAEHNEEITPFSAMLLERSFEDFVKDSAKMETNAPPEFVNATTFYLTLEDEIIGAINVRHELNESLLNFGGHIGYGVRPSKRGNGYAKLMLQMVVPFLKELGLNKVLLTCATKNIASAKTIESCGGVLENQVVNPQGTLTNRYWINLAI